MSVIVIKNVSKYYKIGNFNYEKNFSDRLKEIFSCRKNKKTIKFRALNNINLEILHGEVLGIIGKNGSGKTTLMKVISRVTNPSNGEIIIEGKVASLLEVGTGFHPELTGRENIYLSGVLLGMTKKEIDSVFNQIVDFSGIGKFIETPVKKYSSGMYVRLGFAVAAHIKPEILLIDEVLAVGDADFQKKCYEKIDDLYRKGKATSLVVSHNLMMIRSLCTRAIMLDHGAIVCEGPVNHVIDFYIQSIENSRGNKLISRQDRFGKGNYVFTDIKIFNNQHSDTIVSGSKLKIIIKIKKQNDSDLVITNPRIIIAIYRIPDIPILKLDSNLTSRSYLSSIKNGRIYCETGKLNLGEGTYSVNLGFYNNNELEDHVVNAASFNVLGNPGYYQFNKVIPDKNVNSINIKHIFKEL